MEIHESTKDRPTKQDLSMKNPYPGLRPFLQEESHLFFGRENQVSDVLDKLIGNKFVAIIGNSGIGKSSFINCGILPKLYADHPGVVSNQWEVVTFRPGQDPISELAKAFAKQVKGSDSYTESSRPNEKEILEILKLNGHAGFSELVKNSIKSSAKNLLLFIDQFEEVFRFKPEEKDVTDLVSLFIDLIIKTAKNSDIPVFVVITMRSDYIGECSRYPLLTSAINDSQFLIPQMTREEKKLAITGPCSVKGANINDELVNEILNKVGDDADQLPVMQHALMRTWDYWEENKIGKEEITLNHYRAIGRMESALSVHANEIFNNLPRELKGTCEKCFKNLTEKGEEGRSFRRPATIKELADIAQVPVDEIKEIVENFRKPGRTILTPPHGVALEESTIIDISHESLMRIWGTLNDWMEEEYESTKQYLRIAEAAELHQEGKGTLLKSPELQMATNWYHSELPTKAWGIRHDTAYDRTIEYLLFSEKQFLREQRLKTKQQKRRLFIARLIAIVFGTGAMVAGVLVVFAIKKREQALQAEAEAIIERQKADSATLIAKFEKLSADTARMEALRLYNLSELSAKKARESALQARIEKEKALIQEGRANSARLVALEQQQKAERLGMSVIARSMALKSLQEPDITTKSLVSQQAFNLYYDYGGQGTDPDVYNAVYYSVKALKGKNFNSLKGHTENVRSIVTDANSKYFYSTGSDGKILRWTSPADLTFNQEVLHEDEEQVNMAMALSPNNKWLAVGGIYKHLMLFNLKDIKRRPDKIQTDSRQTLFIRFTADNKKIIYAGSNRKIMVWDFISSREIATVESDINALDIDLSGRYVAIGLDNGKVIGYDLKNNNRPIDLYTDRGGSSITSMKFNETGSMLAVGTMIGSVKLIQVNSRDELASFTGHTARVNQITFNHEGSKVASASWDHTVRIWDLDNPLQQPIVLNDHRDWVWSIGYSKGDNYLFAGCKDNLVRAWVMDINKLSKAICETENINRNLTNKEWETYVGKTVEWECTCEKNCP